MRDTGTDDPRVRIRPSRRGSRPRTKIRPSHDNAKPGLVTAVDRGRYRVILTDGTSLVAMRARELAREGRAGVVVGDTVAVVGDLSGRPDTLCRIVRIEPRSSELRRSTEESDGGPEKVLVANADQLLIVTALADPPPRTGMIDRCLVAAYDAGMNPILCLTKGDLADPTQLIAHYSALELPVVVTQTEPGTERPNTGELSKLLEGHTTVLVGHSGVGKSTLVNALVPRAGRATGRVNEVTGRGRHTSSSAQAFQTGTGWVIDTPGVRSFGLAHVGPEQVLRGFHDLCEAAENCPRGCAHESPEAMCELDTWAAAAPDSARRSRLESFRRLLSSRQSPRSSAN